MISVEGEKAGLSLYTFSAISAFGGGEKLAAKTSSTGMSVWHPVHLTATAYKDIDGVLEA